MKNAGRDIVWFFAAILTAIGLLVLAGCSINWSKFMAGRSLPDLPNFHTVSEGSVYRGAEPTAQGWTNLWNMGVRHVVKLNTKEEGTDAVALDLGMVVTEIPITTQEQIIGPIDPGKLKLAVSAITGHCFIHCGSEDVPRARSTPWWETSAGKTAPV